MFKLRNLFYLTAGLFMFGIMNSTGCSSSTSSRSSATTTALSIVDTGVQGAGAGMGKTAAGGNAVAQLNKNLFSLLIQKAYATGGGVSSVCNSHAQPISGASQLSSTDPDYPSLVFFCAIAYNSHDPDSIQGSYELISSLNCALTNAGLTWDSADHSITVSVDSACFTPTQISNLGASSMSITANASKPASFNSHYDSGITMTIPSFGTFKLGTKTIGTKYEFIALEDQSAVTANKYGGYAGAFDTATGELWFESRHDRFSASTSGSCGSSCGWGRHLRVHAIMTTDSSGNPTGLTSIQGAYASIGVNSSGSTTYSGEVNTISGDMTDGLKARHFYKSTSSALSDLADGSSYSESTNTKCYLTNSSSGVGCGAGIAVATSGSNNFPFSQAGASYTHPDSWVTGLSSGLTFTTVTLDDVQ